MLEERIARCTKKGAVAKSVSIVSRELIGGTGMPRPKRRKRLDSYQVKRVSSYDVMVGCGVGARRGVNATQRGAKKRYAGFPLNSRERGARE